MNITDSKDEPIIITGQDVQAYRAHELPDDLADAIENAHMDPYFDYLNALITK